MENELSLKESSPNLKLDTLVTVEFKYTTDGLWHRVSVSFKEYLEILHNGMVDDKPIVCVEISETSADGSNETIKVIYDFVSLHTGGNPWRLL